MNTCLMKIIFCGPPHSGKTVLIHNLEKFMPSSSYITVRVHKDGEGNWSNNPDQNQVKSVRIKSDYDEEFIKEKCEEIKKNSTPIILVDIGGKLQDDKIPIFKTCDSFVIISNDKKKIDDWLAFGEKYACKCIAILDSTLEEEECIYQASPILKAKISNLERGTDKKNSPVIKALADFIISKSNYSKKNMPFQNSSVIDFIEIAKKLDCGSYENQNDKNTFHADFTADKAIKLYDTIADIANKSKLKSLKIWNARANWTAVLAAQSLIEHNINKISLYDSTMEKYIELKILQLKENAKNKAILDINIIEETSEIFMDIKAERKIFLEDLNSIQL
ncbi:MAG: ATP-binding protein, partial [Treponema sp.]|nr:ATP-binding protein [Treponema sp.]